MDTDDTTRVMADNGFTFAEDPDPASGGAGGDDLDDVDAEFQPRTLARMPWLTRVLLFLAIFAAGFVVGVLVDRALWG